jgi:hypothetical protein
MKKILSILLTVTMVLGLVASFRAPTAEAFPATNTIKLTTSNFSTSYLNSKLGGYTGSPLTDPYWIFNKFSYFNPNPSWGFPGTIHQLNDPVTPNMQYEVYKMGDTIYGTVGTTSVSATPWEVVLAKWTGAAYVAVDVQDQAPGSNAFSISTGNVDSDGEYRLFVYTTVPYLPGQTIATAGAVDSEVVWIVYNLTWGTTTINNCGTTQTVSGWITRGNGQTVLQRVTVYITYPDLSLAGVYYVQPGSSGQFTITFPTIPAGGSQFIGHYYIAVQDGYDGYNATLDAPISVPDTNDAIIYSYLDNTPTITMTAAVYVNPTILYKGVAAQPVVLSLLDQSGNPVTTGVTWTVTDNTGAVLLAPWTQISAGYYRFLVNASSAQEAIFTATKTYYGTTITTNSVHIPLRTLTEFNPYIDINAIYSIPPYGTGPTSYLAQQVYDKLPCTIGNSLEITVNYYNPVDTANWEIYYHHASVSGPVVRMNPGVTPARYLIIKAGTITATIYMQIWERVDKTCPIDETNACCHEYTKTFNVCSVASCTVDKVAFADGTQAITVGTAADLVLSIGAASKPADLQCSCLSKIVYMYMVGPDGNILSNAFTMNTKGGTTKKETVIWWNPVAATGPGIPDQPIQVFGQTDPALLITDNCSTLTFSGLQFNYPNFTDCLYKLVIKIFGQRTSFDACGNMTLTYPMIAELINPITINPVTTTLSSTVTLTEGGLDPTSILMGAPVTIDLTDPHFTITAEATQWSVWLNSEDALGLNAVAFTVSKTDTGYRFILSCPIGSFDPYGNPVTQIVIIGYRYDTNNYCKTEQIVTVTIPVVQPQFTVQIGLMDGSVINNDGILTEGFTELVYVTAVDPRGIHDFTTDTNWQLEAVAVYNDCGLPTSIVCYKPPTEGCTTPSPISVVGFDNPHIADIPQVEIHFISYGCADILVATLKLVAPTVTVAPAVVPFTIPATATHVSFMVTDAHAHGAPGVTVGISNVEDFGVTASGYTWWAYTGVTGSTGEVDWGFVPPFSGRYYVSASVVDSCFYYPTIDAGLVTTGDQHSNEFPCSWTGINTSAILEAKYTGPVVDTTAPVVNATAPATVTLPTVKVTGTVTDNVAVTQLWVGAMKVDFAPDGTFAANVSLDPGANIIKVVAYDAAGNKGEKDLTVTYAKPVVTVLVLQIGSDIMTINGHAVQLDAAPEIVNGSTFLPIRAIAEALGATVTWIPETQGITITLGTTTIGLQIGNTSAVINGNVVPIIAPYIKNGRTMVPFRVIVEGVGGTVQWDPVERTVTVTLGQ